MRDERDPDEYARRGGDSAASLRDCFDPAELKRGDIIRYPAIMRREHGHDYGPWLAVESVDAGGTVHTLKRAADGAAEHTVVTRLQVEENGVVVRCG